MEPRRLRPSQKSDNKLPPFAASAYVKTESSSWKHLKGKHQHSKMGCEQQNHNKDLPVCSVFTPSRALCWGELPAKLELTRKRHNYSGGKNLGIQYSTTHIFVGLSASVPHLSLGSSEECSPARHSAMLHTTQGARQQFLMTVTMATAFLSLLCSP